jgi:hypothetical protein
MTNNFKMVVLIVFGIIILSIFRVKYRDYNLSRTISACIVEQKKTSKLINQEQARKFCEDKIKKKIQGTK